MKTISSLTSDDFISSDVGFIPKSWQCHPLRSLLVESPKYGINAPAVALESEIPVYIRITDISEDGYFRPSEKVGVRSPISHLYRLQEGDIVLARTGASVGKSYLYNADDGELVYAGFLIKVSCDQSLFLPRFLRHFLHTEFFWSWVKVNSMRSGQPGINGNEFARLPIPVPPLSEQTAIANALSDVDALIQELEKLIAKKQAIKTATMQQLLTGRTRLPQFAHHPDGHKKGYKPSELGEIPEDWEVEKFNNLTTLITCGIAATPTYVSESEGYPFLSSTNVKNGKVVWKNYKHISKSLHTQLYKNNPPKVGDVLYSRVGTIGEAAVIEDEFEFSVYVSLTLIKPKSDLFDSYFLMQLLNSEPYKDRAKEQVYLGGGVGNLNVEVVRNYPIIFPQSNEQKAIAKILSDMDLEINSLEQRLGKTRQIKQGMMQELLTGKTRLKL